MRIFLSHASEQSDAARGIEMALRGEGHTVFLDRSLLPPGETYNGQIREAIARSDLFVFLISPEAVASGRYTITEVEFAEEQWPIPAGHVLPVMVTATALDVVPAYLKAVTILEPRGNLSAAVAAAVARLAQPRWRRLVRRWSPVLVLALLAGVGTAAWGGYRSWVTSRDVSRLLEASRLSHQAGNYAAAWEASARAASVAPRRRDVILDQERLAMDWLDDIRVTAGKTTFTGIVETVHPVLSGCAVSHDARRAADCLAHLGWADFLRSREGAGGLDPVQHYRRALEMERDNVYAHAMWGFETLRSGGTLAEARAHFATALTSGRERSYVRRLQIAALLWRRDSESENDVIRVASDIRASNEPMPRGRASGSAASRLWDVYWDRLVNRHDTEPFLSALPAADHLATFRWLFPETDVPPDKRYPYLFMLASLEERAGQRPEALATFRLLRESLARDGLLARGGSLPEGTVAAIERLSRAR